MAVYIERSLQPVLLDAATQFPAVVVTGPRQSGKTTLLKMLQPAALEAWDHSEAEEIRQSIDFTGGYRKIMGEFHGRRDH